MSNSLKAIYMDMCNRRENAAPVAGHVVPSGFPQQFNPFTTLAISGNAGTWPCHKRRGGFLRIIDAAGKRGTPAGGHRWPTYMEFAGALASGILLALALSGRDFWWVGWVALAPALLAVQQMGIGQAFLLGMALGMTQATGLLYWIPNAITFLGHGIMVGATALAALVMVWGSLMGCLMASIRTVQKKVARTSGIASMLSLLFLPAMLWVLFEYLCSHLFERLPWLQTFLGYSQWNHPLAIQVAAFSGVFGISFVMVLVNTALVQGWFHRDFRPVTIAAAIVSLCIGYGAIRLHGSSGDTGRTVRVAILQGNVPAWTKLDPAKGDFLARRYLDLCRQADATRPDLVVWTESAIPWPLQPDDDLVAESLRVTTPSRAVHLVGAPGAHPQSPSKFVNAAFAIGPTGEWLGRYTKRRPLAGVETPLPLPGLREGLKLYPTTDQYAAAEENPVIATLVGRIGVTICNENFSPHLARRTVKAGADFLVNMSNDIWFHSDTPLRQHFGVNVLRCVESGRACVVANNPGVSGIIDPFGRITVRSGAHTHGCVWGTLSTVEDPSFYALYGDVFAGMCCLGSMGWFALSFFRTQTG